MGKSPNSCCSKDDDDVLNSGAWNASEDKILSDYINSNGVGGWSSLPKKAGLKRGGKSCRLRWLNYLRPDIKRRNISSEEEELLIRLHRLLGNRWSLIAGRLPGRTDNEIKNYWNTHLSKSIEMGEFQPKIKKPCKRRDMPCCSDKVVQTDKGICQNIPIKINPEANGLKVADDHVVEIDTSKSWGQLLLEDCMGDYEYDRLDLINGLQANSIIGTDEHHQSPSLTPCRSKIFQEKHSSSSCELVEQAFPHSDQFNSTYLESLMEL